MIKSDYYDNLPEYYDTMYLDGFEPWQILEASHRTMMKRIAERQRQQEHEQLLKQLQEKEDEYTVNINSKVSVKK